MKISDFNPRIQLQIQNQLNENNCPAPSPVAQRPARHELAAAAERKEAGPVRISVRVTSFRRRLCDPDNLVGKYFVDCCRYAGFLRDDSAKDIDYSIKQVEVESSEDERTEIEIFDNKTI